MAEADAVAELALEICEHERAFCVECVERAGAIRAEGRRRLLRELADG